VGGVDTIRQWPRPCRNYARLNIHTLNSRVNAAIHMASFDADDDMGVVGVQKESMPALAATL